MVRMLEMVIQHLENEERGDGSGWEHGADESR